MLPESIQNLITGPKLPSRPQGRMGRDENKSYQNELQAAQLKRVEFFRRRRRFLIGLGATAGFASIAKVFEPQLISLLQDTESEFDGSIEQTKDLLDQWNQQVGKSPDRLISLAPKVARLASTYYVQQMQLIYPDSLEKYDQADLIGKTHIVSSEDYQELTCYDSGEFAGVIPTTGDIYLVPERFVQDVSHPGELVKSFFTIAVHENIHATAKRRQNLEGMLLVEESQNFVGKRMSGAHGLRFFYIESIGQKGEICARSFWSNPDEMVVEDAMVELVSKLNIIKFESEFYESMVEKYRLEILPKFGAKGRWDLLKYQQDSDSDGFLFAIGSKFIDPEAPREIKIRVGAQKILSLTK